MPPRVVLAFILFFICVSPMGGAPADGRELVVTITMVNFEFPSYCSITY